VILVDTGPLVALFDRRDSNHERCAAILAGIREPLRTTVPVLTEAFQLLDPGSRGSDALRELVARGGLPIWFLDDVALSRAFELMERRADRPMDLADASLVVAAETLRTVKVFTADRVDFETYRVRRGHRYLPFEVIR
jgi:uncharacterized protein